MKPNGALDATVVPVLTGGTSAIWVLARATDVATLTLQDDQVFVVLQTNNRPAVVSFSPGTYDVAASDFADGIFPVVIISMMSKDSEKFGSLPVEVVNAFLSKMRMALTTGSGMFPGFEQWYDLNGKRTKFRIAAFPMPKMILTKEPE